jgi:folylpolyglutamate synthase/dihydropteroate synthase
MARRLFPLARDIVLTRPPGERAASPEEIARRAFPMAERAFLRPTVGRALALARRLAAPDAHVVVAGSLYLVGDVLRRRGPAVGRSLAPGQGRRSSEPGGRRRWRPRRAASSRR